MLTEDTRELAEDIGTGHHHEPTRSAGRRRPSSSAASTRTRGCSADETVEIAVDTRALHFFDLDSGLGIYDEPDVPRRASRRQGRAAPEFQEGQMTS